LPILLIFSPMEVLVAMQGKWCLSTKTNYINCLYSVKIVLK